MNWLRYDYGPASVLEMLWTLVALVGFWYTLRCLTECRRDLDALVVRADFRRGGPRHVIARANQRQYVVRIWAFAVYLVIGLFGLTTPPAHANNPSLYAVVLGLGLVSLEVLMTLGSYLDTRDRRVVMTYIASREGAWAGGRSPRPGPEVPP